MKKMLVLGWGGLLVILGTGLLLWVGYEAFIVAQPLREEWRLLKPAILATAFILVGIARIRSQLRKADDESSSEAS
jgi:hypothetical protein